MSQLNNVCLLVLLCIHGTRQQVIWQDKIVQQEPGQFQEVERLPDRSDSGGGLSHFFDRTGQRTGNIGTFYTFSDRSNIGGYLHGDLSQRWIANGAGVRGRFQGNRWHLGGDANVRFTGNRSPSFGLNANAGVELTPRLNLRTDINSNFQRGNRPNIGGGVHLTYRLPRRR